MRSRDPHRGERIEHAVIAHIDVAQNQIAFAVAHPFRQRGDIAGCSDIVALLAERLRQHETQRVVVFSEQNACAHMVSSGSMGRSILNAVRPGALSTSMRPSWRAMISAA